MTLTTDTAIATEAAAERKTARKSTGCAICHQAAEYDWQPFGPADGIGTFARIGWFYRGFPVVKVCYSCSNAINSVDTLVEFTYRGQLYSAYNGKIERC